MPECDDYFSKMMVCLDSEQFPEEARQATRDALAQVIEQWQELPEDAKAQLGPACTAAMNAARTSYEQMGCSFD